MQLNNPGAVAIRTSSRRRPFDSPVSGVVAPPMTNLARWFKADAGVTKDGGNLVSLWVDQMASGFDLAQATGGFQPLWQANQFGSLPGILFDGVDNFLRVASGVIASPITIYWLINQKTWVSNGCWANDTGGSFVLQTIQSGASPNVKVYGGGGYGPDLSTLPVDTNGIASFGVGNPSFSRYNLAAATTGGDTGSTSATGFNLGAVNTGSAFSNINVGEILIYQAAHNTAAQNSVINYLATRGGISV